MATKDRINSIKQMIQTDKKVVVSNLSSLFQVTEETIRRDLEKLESEGILNRTYGGAVLNESGQSKGVHFYRRAENNLVEKKQIAHKFLPYLEDKFAIAADSSTTVMELMKLLIDRDDITLLTNSTEVFNELAQTDIRLVSTGGEFDKNSLSLHGTITEEVISNYFVDICVISCKCLHLKSGVSDSNDTEANIKRAMLKQAHEVALLADHTKFDRKAFVSLIDLEHINYIVTDKRPSDKWIRFCKEKGIKLIY